MAEIQMRNRLWGSQVRSLMKKRDQGSDGGTTSQTVQLDVLEILEQLGIDRADWPDGLPSLEGKQ
ncbi:hypothetical protein GZH47_08405 [Paenibacillus rhizovicinus]|uniref:Uncharacterized protein n=1 Tax=Paenibacillus rhizovicinus TaxID=2704463 RepID=A0A6C0NXC1_9BACL|nr:hypothetical protein [Paenibacillus rhizovicinus]QHW30870.1 hypothetical protein GZH47_08405 [Paenibacillus rhizovicinus]